MSLRPAAEASAPAPEAAVQAPPLAAPRPAAETGCRFSARIGTEYPCGMLVAYGAHLDQAYMITTKYRAQLGGAANRIEAVTPENRVASMIPVQTAMNSVVGGPMYRNVYRYGVMHHGTPFDADTEIASMGAMALDMHAGSTLGEAFKLVRDVLDDKHNEGHSVYAFRIAY